jgi:hypothetical protein
MAPAAEPGLESAVRPAPAFAFGFGLSTAAFDYSSLRVQVPWLPS